MFKRKFRLNAKLRLKNSKSYTSPFFTLRIAENGFLYNRYGFVVSKRIDKRAVVRNKIKRQLRSIIEKMQEEIKEGNDILFIIKKNILTESKELIFLTIKNLLKTNNYLK